MGGSIGARRLAPAAAGAAAFAVMIWLYLNGPLGLYHGILRAWGVKDWAFPFLDTDTVLSAVRCLNRGVDVYVVNPCDVLGRQYDYSPLWMILTVFPMTPAWLTPIGLVVDLTFLLSLLLLPPGRSAFATLLIVLGVVSSGPMYAMERGNNDLVLFALVAMGASLALRRPALRLTGYALLLLAGLLKYYPLATMMIVSRERLPRFVGVAMISIVVVITFTALTWHDLIRALAIIPTGSYSQDDFGSVIVGGRVSELLHRFELKAPVRLVMIALSGGVSLYLSRQAFMKQALDCLTRRESAFLLVGALLIAGCFFTAWNIGYRVIHLLFVLPPLLTLARRPNHRLFAAAGVCCFLLLWSIWWRGIRPVPPISYMTWTLREGMWWFLVTVLDACLIVQVARSATVTSLMEISGSRNAVAQSALKGH